MAISRESPAPSGNKPESLDTHLSATHVCLAPPNDEGRTGVTLASQRDALLSSCHFSWYLVIHTQSLPQSTISLPVQSTLTTCQHPRPAQHLLTAQLVRASKYVRTRRSRLSCHHTCYANNNKNGPRVAELHCAASRITSPKQATALRVRAMTQAKPLDCKLAHV